MRARCDRTPRVSVRKTLQDDEEFLTIRSRSIHLRLLHSQCKLRNPEFHLGDFEQPGFNTGLEQASMEDEREERKGINHGHYQNCGNLLSVGHCGDGAGGHVDHERRGAASQGIRPRRERATSFT